MIFGNLKAQEKTKLLLEKKSNPIILTGPSGLGKYSFIIEHLDFLDSSDIIFPNGSVDQIKESISLSRHSMLNSKFKAVVINDAHLLSIQSQDALLKILEEPPDNSVFIFVCNDRSSLSPALSSRMREEIKWFPLNSEEILEFASSSLDDFALKMCDGRPGFYRSISGNKDFRNFHGVLIKLLESETFSSRIPPLILSFRSLTYSQKETICHLCHKASLGFFNNPKSYERSSELLNFAACLNKFPNVNAEMHWSGLLAVLYKSVDDINFDKRGGRISEGERSSTSGS